MQWVLTILYADDKDLDVCHQKLCTNVGIPKKNCCVFLKLFVFCTTNVL